MCECNNIFLGFSLPKLKYYHCTFSAGYLSLHVENKDILLGTQISDYIN